MTAPRKRRAILIAGPTASGKSRACAAAGRAARRHRHQRRQHAGLPRAAHPHRAADARGRGAGAACALRLRQRRGGLFGRALCRRCGRAPSTQARGSGRVPIVVGGTGLYFKALLEGLSPVPADRPRRARPLARAGRAEARTASCMRSWRRARPGDGGAADADRPPAHRARARGCWRAPAGRSPTGSAQPGQPVLAEDETVRLLVLPDRPALGAEHRRALRRHAGRRRAR